MNSTNIKHLQIFSNSNEETKQIMSKLIYIFIMFIIIMLLNLNEETY